MHQTLLALLLLLPFLALPAIRVATSFGRLAVALTAGAVMAAGLGMLALLWPAAMQGETLILSREWLPQWGLNLAIRLDGLSLLFALLIYGIGLLIVLYAWYYMPDDDRLDRFFTMLLAFAGGMLGVVLAENILLMLLFWEVTSLTSFLLIAYKSQYHDSRIAARMALAVTGGGGLALLAGLLLLGGMVKSFDLSVILASGDIIRQDQHYLPALLLILVGAFTKSAQFPFHFWLPNAMAAPTPVSAYLHSATMVKAGVFLLARLHPALAGTQEWFVIISTTGAITFVMAGYVALLKHDFKGLLAYSTISHLGLITLLFGLDTATSAMAALFHIINHAVFKASLFMAAGIIDKETGTRDMRRINGLAAYMPITAALGIVAAGAMAGVPFLNGFLSKEMFFAETIAHPGMAGYSRFLLPALAVLGGIFSVAYSARFVHDVFFNGQPVDLPRQPKEPPRFMRLPIEILVLLVLAVGVLPQFMVGNLLHAASAAMLQAEPPAIRLAVWHGFNLPLVMSFIALAGGILYYRQRQHLFALVERFAPDFSSPVAFERCYAVLAGGSRRLLRLYGEPTVRRLALPFIGMALLLGLWGWFGGVRAPLAGPLPTQPPDLPAALAFLALALGCIGATLRHRDRLTALIFLSVVGTVVALIFVRFGAPDLALTQLSVELATIMLLLLALRYLPHQTEADRPGSRPGRDWLIAGLSGLGMASLAYAILTRPYETISGFHIAQAKPAGGGTNVVNVILVDFRGFDTLGEIAVLAMAGLGVAALLAGLRLTPRVESARNAADRHPVMLKMLAQLLLPLTLAVAAFIFLRGHNLPGGGFIAGLLAAVAVALQYLAHGLDDADARLRIDYVRLLGVGLAIAVLTGAAPLLPGLPFLTSGFTYISLPGLEKIELASAALFDLGIFLLVFAVITLILTHLGRLSRREQPA